MTTWNVWPGDASAWDELLLGFSDFTVFQSFGWGEYKRRSGWEPLRFTATDSGQVTALAQVLVRRFPLGIAVAWSPGGPVGASAAWGPEFRAALLQAAAARHLYCRVSPMRERTDADYQQVEAVGWHEPTHSMNSGLSLLYHASDSESARTAMASGNWRHNLRRGLKAGHVVAEWPDPAVDEMLAVYGAMETHKNLGEQFSRSNLTSLLEVLGKRCVVVRCNDADGRLLAFRGALVFGSKAWDVFAAATPEARRVYASHSAFWALMRACAERGVEWFDFSGVDPIGNKGVYDFKKGTGAREIRYLGEWEWATPRALRGVADWLIRRSGRLTHAG